MIHMKKGSVRVKYGALNMSLDTRSILRGTILLL